MKPLFSLIIALLACSLAVAQPAVPDSNSTPDSTTAVATTAPAQVTIVKRRSPPPTSNTPLILGFVTMFILTGAGALALLATRKQLQKQHSQEIEALKQENRDREEALRAMEQSILELKKLCNKKAEKPVAPVAKPQEPKPQEPRTIYLSRPDEHGFFMSSSTQLERGNSIFQLTTLDGKNGTFIVIDDSDVHHLALMMPTENLTRACTGNNIQVSSGMKRIVTDTAGHATLENGRWRIATMATIHYQP